jgi:hypothetical protein
MQAFRHSTGAQRRLPDAAQTRAAWAPEMYACGYTFGTLTARSECPSSSGPNAGHGTSRPSGITSTSESSHRSTQNRFSTLAISGGHTAPGIACPICPSTTS